MKHTEAVLFETGSRFAAGSRIGGSDGVAAGRGIAGRSLRPLLLGTVAVVVIVCPPAGAQNVGQQAGTSLRIDAERQLETRKDRLTSAERRAQSLNAAVEQIQNEQARINERLISTGQQAQHSERQMSRIEARLGELDAQEKLIRGSLAQRHGQMASLFAAMQRMGRNPPPVIVTRREDALKMVRSAMLMARAFPGLKVQADELAGRLNDLVRVMADARRERERLGLETSKLNEARTRLATLVENKRQSLDDRQRELSEVRRVAGEISRTVSNLSELIKKLDSEVARRTALGAYEREQKARAAAEAAQDAAKAQARPTIVATPTVIPATPVPSSTAVAAAEQGSKTAGGSSASVPAVVAQQAPKGQQVALNVPGKSTISLEPRGSLTQNPGRLTPAIPFHKSKGRLPLPAHGRQRLGFGAKTQFGSTSRGVVIETRPGATVISPCDGWVVYSGPFRSYGQVLIINAGDGYHVLLANLERIDVEVGRFVLLAEPVGTMSTNFTDRSQNASPELYVEFRNKSGKSIDPSPWWAEGSQKVQG